MQENFNKPSAVLSGASDIQQESIFESIELTTADNLTH